MRIDPEKRLESLRPTRSRSKNAAKTEAPATPGDLLALNQVRALVDDLIEMPEIREEVVKLGQRLAQDPNYPSPEVVEEVAKILAKAIAR